MTDLDPLAPARLDRVELVTVRMPLTRPVATVLGTRSHRDVLLVHAIGDAAEGWAECVAEPEPSYGPEFTAGASLVLREHVLPALEGEVDATSPVTRTRVRGHPMALAALELAVLDVQLQAAGRSLAGWLGASRTTVPCGATIGLPAEPNGFAGPSGVLAAVADAIDAGARRVRVKIGPGRSSAVAAIRAVHPDLALQADANGAFDPRDPAHLAELGTLDEWGLVCLEQPFSPDDLLSHARLAERLVTPICLDEPITSVDAFETAVAVGACEVVCLKPSRLGSWAAARRLHDRAVELGIPVWVGGMFETALGRAANLAVAALPGMALPGDFDPRGWFEPDLAPSTKPDADGYLAVPNRPGTGVAPDGDVVSDAAIGRVTAWRR